MSVFEFPDAISRAIMRIGDFFSWINTGLFNLGWILTFAGVTLAFFVIQIFFIYMYYRIIMIAFGFKPRIEQFLKKVDELFV
jgi:hypothetical protein